MVGTALRCRPRNGVQKTARPTFVFLADSQMIVRDEIALECGGPPKGIRRGEPNTVAGSRAFSDLLSNYNAPWRTFWSIARYSARGGLNVSSTRVAESVSTP